MSKKYHWQHKTVWLIGASSGIGLALAHALQNEGAHVVVSARPSNKLERVAQQGIATLALDVCDATSIETALATLCAQGKPIDAVFYLAGDYEPMSSTNIDLTRAQKIIDVNLKGALNVVAMVLPVLRRQPQALLVLTASLAGLCGLPNSLAYGASKAGVIHLAQSLRAELIDTGVDVRVVNPGFVKTELTDKNTFTMPFLMTPDEAAAAILKGLDSSSFAIDFPKRFRFIFTVLGWLPDALYFWVVKHLR